MKAKQSFLIITGLLIYLSAGAQYILNGTITDRLNGEPLTGANVRIENSQTGTVTNMQGHFSLRVNELPATLVISYVGYETLRFTATEGEMLEIGMKRDLIAFSDDVVVVGSRNYPRTVTSSAVPVDQFPEAVLKNTGQTDLSQQINSLAPSFYSSRLTYSDATDHMDPAALRGMNPDQTLILVNGKRKHPSAVVNVLSVVGKGSVINDLNTIPSSAVERVEILRDGASAQYGSDAIAGVINIVLKKDTGRVILNTSAGQFYEGDGFERNFTANFGTGIGEKGYVNLTSEIGMRDHTNRSGIFEGLIYRTADQDGLSFEENLALDNQELANRGLEREDFRLKLGNSELSNATLYFNSEVPLSERSSFYAFGGMNYRSSISAGDYRFPNDPSRVNLNLYPNGFLPEISAKLSDNYIVTGFQTWITDWQVDLSNTFGRNSINFYVGNSVNASMGDDSPFEFESGGIAYTQNTTNLDFSHRKTDLRGIRSLNMTIGSEFRLENYRINAGEEASWINEDQASFPGAQGFPGYQPVDETNQTRTNTAVYADLGIDISRPVFVEFAARYEDYSDFGNNLSGKAAFRVSPLDWVNVRGSVSSGFRAPALHQKHYSNTGTYYFSGFLFEVLTAPNNSRVTSAFGIPALSEETSLHYNLGFSLTPWNNTNLSFDIYQIDVKDRIVLSSTFFRFDPVVDALLSDLPDVGGAQFFTNAVDTRTRGIDIVYTESVELPLSRIGLSAGVNLNETKVIGEVKASQEIIDNGLESTLFDRQARALLELAQPRNKVHLSGSYIRDRLVLTLRAVRFGEVSYRGIAGSEILDQDYGAKWVSDVRIDYRLLSSLKLTLGVNNVFDVYPDKNNEALSNYGQFPYNTAVTQFGFNGGFYYAGLEVEF